MPYVKKFKSNVFKMENFTSLKKDKRIAYNFFFISKKLGDYGRKISMPP